MSDIVLKWLNADIGLSRPVQRFETDLANGFLLGELLHKHGFLDDFRQDFVDETGYEVQTANFAHLRAALRGPAKVLGVSLRDEQVKEIMGGDRGSSLRLLFQLRKAFEKAGVTSASPTSEPKKPGLQLTEKRNLSARRAKLQSEQMRQKTLADEVHSRDLEAKWNAGQSFRQSRLVTMRENREVKRRTDTEAQERWAASVQRKVDQLGADLKSEKASILREHRRVENVRKRNEQDCGYKEGDDGHGIAWFENNLQRIGIDTSEHAGSSAATIEAANPKELYEKMQEKIPPSAQLQVESAEKMAKIREAKKAGDLARRERDQRQRKVQVEQQATQAFVEQQKQEEEVLVWLAKEAMECRVEAMVHEQQLHYKEAARVQRQKRQEELDEVLAQRSAEATALFIEKAQQDREAILHQKQDNEHGILRSELESLEFPELQAQSSDESSDEEEDGVQLDPLTGLWGTVRSFSASRRSRSARSGRSPAMSQKAGPAEAIIRPSEELLAIIKDSKVYDYFYGRGTWKEYQSTEEEARSVLENHASLCSSTLPSGIWQARLGNLVQWLCKPAPPCAGEVELPHNLLPMVAVVSGLAGQGGSPPPAARIARRLAEDFGFALVEPAAVIQECIALSQKPEREQEWPVLARMRQLGNDFMTALQANGYNVKHPAWSPSGTVKPAVPIPYGQFAEALFRKIELLATPPPKPVEEEEPPDPKGKKKPAKPKGKKKDDEEDAPPKPATGIVLSGFASELATHAAWELSLHGYTSPLQRIMDSEEDLQVQLNAVFAPWWSLGQQPGDEPHVPAAASVGAKASEAEQWPVYTINIGAAERGSLSEALVSQISEESARLQEAQAPPPARSGKAAAAEENAEPTAEQLAKAFACQGLEMEKSSLEVVDRTWVQEETQLLVRAFGQAAGSWQDVKLQVAAPTGSLPGSDNPDDACFEEARDLVKGWRHSSPGEQDEGAADQQETEPGDINKTQEDNEGVDQDDAASAEEPHTVKKTMSTRTIGSWLHLGAQARSSLRNQWLESVSSYIRGTEDVLTEAQTKKEAYCNELVSMQGNFLDFLQRPDDKGAAMSDFIKTWPQKVAETKPQTQEYEENLEDLSDRLWQFTDQRRAEAVQERIQIMEGGFWEEWATGTLHLAERLQMLEHGRFHQSVQLLCEACGYLPIQSSGPVHPGEPRGLSSLREIRAWVRGLTDHLTGHPAEAGSAFDEGTESSTPGEEFRAALLAEQMDLAKRLRAIEAWVNATITTMREQLDEVFRRMDDWIRDRVRMENEAIKAAVAEVRNTDWSSNLAATDTPKSTLHRASVRSQKEFTSHRKQRREVLGCLEAKALEAEIFKPLEEKARQSPAAAQDPLGNTVASGGQPGQAAVDTGAATEEDGGAFRSTGCWDLEMLQGLLGGLARRCDALGVLTSTSLREELLARKYETLSWRSVLVPAEWVTRSDEAYAALCDAFLVSGWGYAAVDATEFMLALTFHNSLLDWPNMEALEASRISLETAASENGAGLGQPPIAEMEITEEDFMRLPLWDHEAEAAAPDKAPELGERRRWIFEVLCHFGRSCTSASSSSRAAATGTRMELSADNPSSSESAKTHTQRGTAPRTVTVGRLFSYLGVGCTPTTGLQQALRLLMRQPPAAARNEEGILPHEVRVKDLWMILFSQGLRPATAVSPAPSLADFCEELVAAVVPPEPDPDPKGKAKDKDKGKSKGGKKAATPVEEEVKQPPPPPEETTVPLTCQELERHPLILRGLCSHGGLLCRRRVLPVLFSEASFPLVKGADAREARGIATLVPTPTQPPAVKVTPEV